MGIDPLQLPDRFKERMEPADRKELGIQAPSERHARLERTLEREQQNLLASWLALREADGVLVFDWSRTDRQTTNRKGMPDFRLYAKSRTLLGEMKVGDGKCSAEQFAMIEKFRRAGTEVQVWYSAAQGIEAIRDWLCKLL